MANVRNNMDALNEENFCSTKELDVILENDQICSENETFCSSYSFIEEFSKIYEQELDNQLDKYRFQLTQSSDKVKKKRGRKLLRPNDPIRKKTEIKDKYWLRAFRNFVKVNINKFKDFFSSTQLEFWDYYVSNSGKPGKNSKFLSYGKSYKNFLFAEPSFLEIFKAWLLEFGQAEISKKYEPGSDLWFIYYDYALKEIAFGDNDCSFFRKFLKEDKKL